MLELSEPYEPYVPDPIAAAGLLQLALENFLLGYAETADIEDAVETAFLGTDRFGISQEGVSGRFDRDSIGLTAILGAQGIIKELPVVTVEGPENGTQEIKLGVDSALQPLFVIYPVDQPSDSLAIVPAA